jgi:hypothetical protein
MFYKFGSGMVGMAHGLADQNRRSVPGGGRFPLSRFLFSPAANLADLYDLRARRLLTVIARQGAAAAVAIPRAFSASSIARRDLAPARYISRTIGSAFAA